MDYNLELVTAYKTQDGKVFILESEAKNHQERIELEDRVSQFAHKHATYTEGIEQLYDAIIENAEELKTILSK